MDDDDMLEMTIKVEEEPIKLRRPRKIRIPRREPTIILPPVLPHYPSPDKSTCADCGCFPKEEPYRKHKKLTPCQQSPAPLYALAAAAVERLPCPRALHWTLQDVVRWCEEDLALPQYRQIVHAIRALYGTEFIRFSRSVGLPPRRPLVHCTCHRSRTGPTWGIRQNWTRADVLRWMKIIMPAPVYRDHWELVWYQRAKFPTVKVGRVEKWQARPPPAARPAQHYVDPVCKEYQVPRKFRLLMNIPEKDQMIWMERPAEKTEQMERKVEEKAKRKEGEKTKKKHEFHFTISEESNLLKRPVTQEGKRGDQLILARRNMNKPKFLAF